MADLFENAIVEKRNVLNELRSGGMTVQELRFFSVYLSKINPWDVTTRCVRFPVSDFQKIMGFGRLNIKQLQESADSLLCKLVHIPDEDGRGIRAFQLFKECHLFKTDDEKWFIEIDAHDKALPLMFDFKNRYFKYKLWNALRLKSTNQIRMYEILKQYESLGRREITVSDLRELLGIAKDEYMDRNGWSNFKIRVLDSCQQALKENTDICYTYERGKTGAGGKWLTIIFHISKNEDYKDPLSLEQFIDLQPMPEVTIQAERRLKGKNQARMYEILKQYEFLGKCEMKFTLLRELLGIKQEDYSGRTGWSDFRKKVLDSCQQALKENTDICYTYERGRAGIGGKWITIIFHISKNENYKDPVMEQFVDRKPKAEIFVQTEQSADKEEELIVQPTYLDEEPQKEEQKEAPEPVSYGGELADLLGETCNHEFTPKQIRVIQDLVLRFIGHDYIMCSDYLSHKLNLMEIYKPKEKNRFWYLVAMITNDIKDPDNAL